MTDFFEVGADGRSNRILADTGDPCQLAMQSEEIDRDEELDFKDIKRVPRDALLILLRFIVPAGGKSKWRIAHTRLAVLSHLAGLEGVADLTFEELGNQLGCSRALLSLRSLEMIDGFQMNKGRNGKRRETRATYSASATASHERRGNKLSSQLLNAVDDR